MKSKKTDNRGMTLLELIIAVAIFSIAAMTLLQAFVTSGRINKKSNLYLEATTTAQNVMEEIKAKSFADFAAAINYPSGSSRISFLEGQQATLQEVTVTKNDNGSSYVPVAAASVISDDKGVTYKLNPDSDGSKCNGKYYYEMIGVTGTGCHETFDVLAEFDASSDTQYKSPTTIPASGSTSEAKKNDYEMPNIAKLDSKTNGFLLIPSDWGKDVLGVWKEQGKITDDSEDILSKVKKTVTIALKTDKKTNLLKATAQYKFDYTTESGLNLTYTGNEVTFFGAGENNELNGIYLFYYPNYTDGTKDYDNIVFENDAGAAVNFYVIKQKDEGTGTPTTTQENKYHMMLTVKEVQTESGMADPSKIQAQTVLKTNLNYDISDNATDNGSTLSQMDLTYNPVVDSAEQTITGSAAEEALNLNGLDDKKAEDRIYTVKVSVYKSGAAANGFPEDDRVVTLDGAKED